MMRSKLTKILAAAAAIAVGGAVAGVSGGSPAGAAAGVTTIVCDNGTTATDGAIEYDLEARDGYIEFPDGNTVYTWSYAPVGQPFQFPGPTMCVDQGATVRVTLTNPASGTTLTGGIPADYTSIVFPGQTGVTAGPGNPGLLTTEVDSAVPGDSVTYEFTASAPGTYLYESGTDQAVQIQMGMFGSLVVYPSEGRNFAYPGKEFDTDAEYLLVFHEMDPDLHAAVELASLSGTGDAHVLADYDPLARHNRYFTINGRAFPDTISPNGTPLLPSQPYGSLVRTNADDPNDGYNQLPSLVRYANAGLDNHPFHPHGNHLTLIAEDGRPLPDSIEAYTKTVASGQTYDLLAAWNDVEPWQGNNGPVEVNIPALDNQIFKGGVTFYSGDPDLGDIGQFPGDIVSYSACGEYYFPWHSHALQEVVNYDVGFGGMLTLWRVDPPKVNVGGAWVTPEACQ